jgi:pimeloyl-ACP methyl ester carboxylesterase
VSDPLLEKLLQVPGRAVWRQIKHAAEVANSPDGGLSQLANSVQTLRALVPDLEVHLVGHSAGAVVLGPLVASLQKRRVPLASAHLFAPACTVGFANQYWLQYLGTRDPQKNTFPLYVSLLSDALERRDNVALAGVLGYQKSLLYLVARSFEDNTPTPLLGMEGAWDRSKLWGQWDNAPETLLALRDFERAVAELQPNGALVCQPPLSDPMTCTRTDAQGRPVPDGQAPEGGQDVRIRTAHGSLDGDALLLLRTLALIRGGAPLQSAIDLSQVP